MNKIIICSGCALVLILGIGAFLFLREDTESLSLNQTIINPNIIDNTDDVIVLNYETNQKECKITKCSVDGCSC